MVKNCKVFELRGAWVATAYGIDWPKTQNDIESQKQEFIEILERLKKLNFNSVFVQVRPESDAFYKSKINPWSKYLTGVQGKDPGYDPLEFMIKETHKRNMEFNAWLNPYRVTTSETNLSDLAINNPAKLNPSWTFCHKNNFYYDPENPEVIKYIATTVFEIVVNYNVDGIYFDDYFYPPNYPLPVGEDRDGEVANNRREAINEMMKLVNKSIKSTKSNVKFGVSPPGIWKSKSSDPNGSATNNSESYYDIYADSLKWIEEGIIDSIAPQIYWTIEDESAPYKVLVKWWSDVVKNTNVNLYIGQNIDNVEIAEQIEKQININRLSSEVKGSIFFSMRNIENDTGGVVQQLKNVYRCKAIIP